MKKSVNVQTAATIVTAALVGGVIAYVLWARRRKKTIVHDAEQAAHRLQHATQDSGWNQHKRSKFSQAAGSFGAANR